jgi:hypothetical protein
MPRRAAITGTSEKKNGKTEISMNLPPGLFGGGKFDVPEPHPEKLFTSHLMADHDKLVGQIREAIEGETCAHALRALVQVLGEVQNVSGVKAGYPGLAFPV